MLFRRQKNLPPLGSAKLQKRVTSLSHADLVSWSNVAINNVGRMLSNYENNRGGIESLKDAWVEAEALLVLLDRLITVEADEG